MPIISLVVLYVSDPKVSAGFYTALLDQTIVEASTDFAMVPLGSGVMLGLWSRSVVVPQAEGSAGSSEIVFNVADPGEVDTTFARWREREVRVIQPPQDADFGRTFLVADPDGHRLRVMAAA